LDSHYRVADTSLTYDLDVKVPSLFSPLILPGGGLQIVVEVGVSPRELEHPVAAEGVDLDIGEGPDRGGPGSVPEDGEFAEERSLPHNRKPLRGISATKSRSSSGLVAASGWRMT